MKTIDRTIVAAVLVSKDKKVFLGRQRQGGVYPDCWHIPGGGVDQDETLTQALIREVKEEVGLDISDCPIKLISDTDSDMAEKTDKITGERFIANMHFNSYQVDLLHNAADIKVSLDDDLVDYRWVDLDDLKNYKHTPPSFKMFAKMGLI